MAVKSSEIVFGLFLPFCLIPYSAGIIKAFNHGKKVILAKELKFVAWFGEFGKRDRRFNRWQRGIFSWGDGCQYPCA